MQNQLFEIWSEQHENSGRGRCPLLLSMDALQRITFGRRRPSGKVQDQPGTFIECGPNRLAGPKVQYWWCVYSGHRVSPMSEQLQEKPGEPHATEQIASDRAGWAV
ncbi:MULTISPECIES: hypothetical protein [Pseudomonas]|uniref:hypothetical protein n=1 Tax=Pseudomonas TaxID=286 RepID=UPI001112EEFC|nr:MULTISPECIES: hypothetical protein [Pseudomonas]MCL8306836.1 hypothetical protein [Pseudomonas putida]